MDYSLLLPEFVLVGLAFTVLAIDLFLPKEKKPLLAYVSIVGLIAVMASALTLQGKNEVLYGGLLLIDDYAFFFKFFFPVIAIFVILMSIDYVKKRLHSPGEYYGIILFSTLAMMMMTAAGELLTAYISLELLSFSLYVLVAYGRHDPKSNEAGLKYILLGAFASALLLYGMSMIYGVAETTTFSGIASALQSMDGFNPGLLVGLVLLIAGLGFKVAAVPFHMWAPDVYEGAPTPVTAYLSVASKAAGFALLLRLFAGAFIPVADDWRWIIIVLAALTMTLGNLVAIHQTNIKRLLAYSSIGQVGYLLLGIASIPPHGDPMAASAILFHLAGYAISNLAAFTCIIIYSNLTDEEEIAGYAGMAQRAPFVAFVFSISLLSLAGLPFFAGFVTKFYLFTAATEAGLLWLMALAIVTSLISVYYYLLVIKPMYIGTTEETSRLHVPNLLHATLGVLALGVGLIGIYPAPLLNFIDFATKILFL